MFWGEDEKDFRLLMLFSFLLDAWDQGNIVVSQTFATRCSESRAEGPMIPSVIECAEGCVCKESVSLRTPKTKFSEQ